MLVFANITKETTTQKGKKMPTPNETDAQQIAALRAEIYQLTKELAKYKAAKPAAKKKSPKA